jgi:hypothetical protein
LLELAPAALKGTKTAPRPLTFNMDGYFEKDEKEDLVAKAGDDADK